jgi:hypothetical protein
MDGQRFDAWTRLLTRGMSRRSTLKTLAGIALTGITSRIAVREAEANTGCADFGLPYSVGECCSPYVCRAGSTSICGYCLDPSAYCAYGGECCSGICEFSVFRLGYVCKEPKKDKRHAKHDDKHHKKHHHG